MSYDVNNVFAKILRGDLPHKKIAEGEHYLAFHNIAPQSPIHGLVIPKGPYTDAHDFHKHATTDEIVGFYKGIADTVDVLNLYGEGFRQISNCGINGGQEVPHYHIHIVGGGQLGAMLSKK